MFSDIVNKAKLLIDSDEEAIPPPRPPPREEPPPEVSSKRRLPPLGRRRKKVSKDPVQVEMHPPPQDPPPQEPPPPLIEPPPKHKFVEKPPPSRHHKPPQKSGPAMRRKASLGQRRSSATMPMRPKSRAVVLPSGFVISGSDDSSTIRTSQLSTHASDDFSSGDNAIVRFFRKSDAEDGRDSEVIRSVQSRPSEGDIDVTRPVALFPTDDGVVCADTDKPDVVCSSSSDQKVAWNSIHRKDDDNAVKFKDDDDDEGKDPRIWTEEDERGKSEEEKILRLLPSRSRHSSRRKKKPSGEPVPDVAPAQEDDIESQIPSKRGLSRRSGSARSSIRSTLKSRKGRSLKRTAVTEDTGAHFTLAARKTIRRGELEEMEKFEVKKLPMCTRIGYEFTLAMQRGWRKFQEGLRNMKIWGQPIKEVEGNFGSGVATYFRVLRWLLKINLLNLFIALLLITLPGVYLNTDDAYGNTHNDHTYNKDDMNCTSPLFRAEVTRFDNVTNDVFQFLTGSGWMEATPLYIGWYPTQNITNNGDPLYKNQLVTNGTVEGLKVLYNFPLAYVIAGMLYYLISLIFIARNIQRLFKKSAVESLEESAYTSLIFCGWDYTIVSAETAKLKSRSILKELKEELHMDRSKENEFSTKKMILLYTFRIFTWFLCLAAMGGVFYLFYQQFSKADQSSSSCEASESFDHTAISVDNLNETVTSLWNSYGTSVIVSVSNIIFPIFFEIIGNLEMYQFQATRINITMLRSFVMKLFSVIVYLIILFRKVERIKAGDDDDGSDDDETKERYYCWENFVAMEMYKLCIMDFVIFLIALFCSEIFRAFLVRHIKCLKGKLDVSEFNIPKEVLDICYKQMIFWASLFWAPLMTVVAVVEIILIFYVKKFSAMHNVRPPDKVVLNSKNSSVINLVYLISLLSVFMISGYYVFRNRPSEHCGPYQIFQSFTDPLNNILATTGDFKTYILDNVKTTSILVVVLIIVCLIIYYFHSLAASRQLTVQLLRKQIRIENADKKFLIEHIKGHAKAAATEDIVLNDDVKNGKKSKKKAIGSYANPQMKIRSNKS